MDSKSLKATIQLLRAHYGEQPEPALKGPWEMVLWENIAYLADDRRRGLAFQCLKQDIGVEPKQILATRDKSLIEVTRHGILPQQFVEKLRTCARIAADNFAGKLDAAIDAEPAKAKELLQQFPGIGSPGADKILLFSGKSDLPSVESNGVRVLTRLGFFADEKNYPAAYGLAQRALRDSFGQEASTLRQAYLILRAHGKELCRRSAPVCNPCPVNGHCAYFQKAKAPIKTAKAI